MICGWDNKYFSASLEVNFQLFIYLFEKHMRQKGIINKVLKNHL